eukprot:TRINITY_DN836_c1_g1_i3.p3 TRINITY_DN836_c1_g1~~TRINITY_DN836_c1_g1_i3.p3  ORF type:complete len:211 (+),score=37.64 TRINITY_DN836_c1_g1_i3:40-672(+)
MIIITSSMLSGFENVKSFAQHVFNGKSDNLEEILADGSVQQAQSIVLIFIVIIFLSGFFAGFIAAKNLYSREWKLKESQSCEILKLLFGRVLNVGLGNCWEAVWQMGQKYSADNQSKLNFLKGRGKNCKEEIRSSVEATIDDSQGTQLFQTDVETQDVLIEKQQEKKLRHGSCEEADASQLQSCDKQGAQKQQQQQEEEEQEDKEEEEGL